MIWIITWRYLDGSSSGVIETAYEDEAIARHFFEMLEREVLDKEFGLRELNVLRTEKRALNPVRNPSEPAWLRLRNQPGTPIRDLNLTIRAERCLMAEEIETIEQLVLCRESDLLKTPNLGRKSLTEIKEALALRGMRLA